MLLAYFSRPGENYHYGGRTDLEVGNTQVLADAIASAVAADVYRIEAAEPYPDSYQATVERNKQEQDDEARPAIAGSLPSVEPYDAVLLGSPIWNAASTYDHADVRREHRPARQDHSPLCHLRSQRYGQHRRGLHRLCPDATTDKGLAVRGEEVHGAGADVTAWLQRASLTV